MPAHPVTATRRTALVAAAGLTGLAVGGCTSDSPTDPTDQVTTSAPPVDADQILVDDVVERLDTALSAVVMAGDESPPLAVELAALKAMHVAHLEALDDDASWSTYAGPAPTRREVLRTEARATALPHHRRRPCGERHPGQAAGLDVGGSRAAPGGARVTYLDALQTALAVEHAAVYVYGALGAQTSQSAEPRLYADIGSAYNEHRALRDQLVRLVLDEAGTPVAAQPAYELPADLSSPALVMRTALRLEKSCAETYAYLVANSPQERRRWAINALVMAAVRELAFRGIPEIFPGSDEYADR